MSTKKNTLYNMAYRTFSVFLPLATAPYLSRTCGTTGVGLYSHAWNINYVFWLIGLLGLENYGVRAIARERNQQDSLNRTFSSIWRMQRWVASAALAAYVLYAILLRGAEQPIALSLIMTSLSCLINLDWCLMGLDEFRLIAIRNTAVKLCATASVFLFVHSAEDLWIYGLCWSLATLAGCIMCAVSLRGRVKKVPVTLKESFRHLRPCAVLFLAVLAVSVYRTMDKVMVGSLAGMDENGLYEDAEKIIYCLSGFISAFGTVMMPKVSHMWKEGRKEAVQHAVERSMHLVMAMVCAMAFGVAAVARVFAPLFYGDAFIRSGDLMIPLAFSLVMIGFANVIRTHWVLPIQRDKIVLRSVCTGAIVNLIANTIMIPGMGAMGAVVGTLLAEFSVPFVQWMHLRRELDYRRYLLILCEYTVIGFLMFLAVRFLLSSLHDGWVPMLFSACAGAVLYAVLCMILWKATGNQSILRLFRRSRMG